MSTVLSTTCSALVPNTVPPFADVVYSAELKLPVKQAWRLTAVITAPGRLKQEDCCEFKSLTKKWDFASKNIFLGTIFKNKTKTTSKKDTRSNKIKPYESLENLIWK